MIHDRRRAPFCYQTQPALDRIRERFRGGKRSTALAVYLVLTEIANRVGGEEARGGFRASRTSIAREVGVSVDTLDRYIGAFVEVGLLAVEREKMDGVNLPNRWVLLEVEAPSGAGGSRTGTAMGSRTGAAQGLEEERTTSSLDKKESSAHDLVCEAWGAGSPPLIAHRASYFASSTCRSAVKRALAVYPVEDVVAAVGNYAAVLGGSEYRWSYSWTLEHFMKRGLDRFVPEANPLSNYAVRSGREPQRRVVEGIDRL